MMYNDSGKPTLNVIWKKFEKFLIDYDFEEIGDSGKMPWDEDAEKLIKTILKNAKWDYENKTVSIIENEGSYEYNTIKLFEDEYDLFLYLENQAEGEVISTISGDKEFREMAMKDFDAEQIVNSILYNAENEAKLKKIGWI